MPDGKRLSIACSVEFAKDKRTNLRHLKDISGSYKTFVGPLWTLVGYNLLDVCFVWVFDVYLDTLFETLFRISAIPHAIRVWFYPNN